MSGHPLIANPLGWAHLRIYGGPRKLFMFLGGYSVVLIMLLVLVYRLVRNDVALPRYCGYAMNMVLVLQMILLFFFGTVAIKRAILQDFTSEMITSHRLTGMGGLTAVIGYITGPTSQLLAMVAVNCLFCTVLAVISGYLISQALLVNAAILLIGLLLTAMFWTLAVLVGLSTRGKVAITGILAAFVFLHQVPVFYLLPGLEVLLPRTAIGTTLRNGDLSDVGFLLLIGMVSQFVLAGLFFLAAGRKFARDDVLAFTPTLSFVLVAVCSLVGAVGLAFDLKPNGPAIFDTFHEPSKQLIATASALTIIAILPVMNAAKSSVAWARRKRKDAAFTAARPRTYGETALICSILILSIGAAVCAKAAQEGRFDSSLTGFSFVQVRPVNTTPILSGTASPPAPGPRANSPSLIMRTSYSTAALVLSLLTVGGLLRFYYSIAEKATWLLALYVIVFWAIPPFVDLSLEAVSGADTWTHRTILFTSSPVGLTIAAWMKLDAPMKAGMVVQAVLAGLAYFLSRRSRD